MKPELRAMVAQAAGGSPYYLEKVFLAALHWRDPTDTKYSELWCGPLLFGCVKKRYRCPWKMYVYTRHMAHLCGSRPTKDTACAALEAAAREQIAKWFKEKS